MHSFLSLKIIINNFRVQVSQVSPSGDVWIGEQSGGFAPGVSHWALSPDISGCSSDVSPTPLDGYQHQQSFPYYSQQSRSARTNSGYEIH